ncbi:MAG: hypothetical protein Q9213_002809 [Squamulea squamosa]
MLPYSLYLAYICLAQEEATTYHDLKQVSIRAEGESGDEDSFIKPATAGERKSERSIGRLADVDDVTGNNKHESEAKVVLCRNPEYRVPDRRPNLGPATVHCHVWVQVSQGMTQVILSIKHLAAAAVATTTTGKHLASLHSIFLIQGVFTFSNIQNPLANNPDIFQLSHSTSSNVISSKSPKNSIMRRSSMRRGSAVFLSILPLLSPTYALPTYFGNEATVSHMHAERAALPEPAISLGPPEPAPIEPIPAHGESASALDNIASEGPEHWLLGKRREKRQSAGSDSVTGAESGSENIGWGGVSGGSSGGGGSSQTAPVTTERIPVIPNTGSYGPKMWLGTAKRDIEEREAAPEANPAVTLDMDYVPPALDFGLQNLGAPQ